jgi:hypothetical protein
MTEYALFLDDGGHPDDQPFLVVAGYVSSESKWRIFEPVWRDALARFELGPEFHMAEFMSRRKGYSALRFDQILGSLAAIIKAHTLLPFMCAIDIGAYRRVNDEFALEECHGAPYAIASRSLAGDLNSWKSANLGLEDRLLIFVEAGTKHYGDLEQVFKRDSLPHPSRVPKEMPQVQPADILAWELFNFLRTGSPKHPTKNLDRLVKNIRKKQQLGGILYEVDLRRICKDTDTHRRNSLRPGDTIAFHSERKRKRKRTIV